MGYIPNQLQSVPVDYFLEGKATRSKISQLVCERHAVTMEELMQTNRGVSRIADARAVAMYLLRVGLGMSHPMIGQRFSRDQNTVRTALIKVRDSGPLKRDALETVEALGGNVPRSARRVGPIPANQESVHAG